MYQTMQSLLSAHCYLIKYNNKPTSKSTAAREVIEVPNKNTHHVNGLDWIKPKAFLEQKHVQKSHQSSLSFQFLEVLFCI